MNSLGQRQMKEDVTVSKCWLDWREVLYTMSVISHPILDKIVHPLVSTACLKIVNVNEMQEYLQNCRHSRHEEEIRPKKPHQVLSWGSQCSECRLTNIEMQHFRI